MPTHPYPQIVFFIRPPSCAPERPSHPSKYSQQLHGLLASISFQGQTEVTTKIENLKAILRENNYLSKTPSLLPPLQLEVRITGEVDDNGRFTDSHDKNTKLEKIVRLAELLEEHVQLPKTKTTQAVNAFLQEYENQHRSLPGPR